MHKSYGTGRRKTSNARVYLKEGTGEITINSKNLDDFVSSETLKSFVLAPLEKTKMEKKVDLKISVCGGGPSGQVGAIVHGVSRALVKYQNDMRELASTRYNFKGPENPGTIPKKIQYQDKEYTLIEETHCAVCDNPQCQEMFQYQDDRETGLSMMFYPILPVYTHNREKELCALCLGL